MKRFVQEGTDLFGYDAQAEAAAFAVAHHGGLAPMPLAPDYDGSGRNDAAVTDTLAETGQVNDFQATASAPVPAERVRTTTQHQEAGDILTDPELDGLTGIGLARAIVARNGHPQTDPDRRAHDVMYRHASRIGRRR